MTESIKKREKQIKSKRGRILFRRDLRALNLCRRSEIVLNQKNIGLLGPFNGKMIWKIFKRSRQNESYSDLILEMRGMVFGQKVLEEIFPLTKAYKRLAEFKY